MIKKASTLIVEFWIKNAIIKTDDKESYCYGMELILSTLINVAFMVILSYYVIGYPIAFIPYIAVYTPLRLTAGGYHARSHLKCILYTQIGIGMALVGEPDLLVLDEPINGLDPQGIAEVRDTIQNLCAQQDMTVFISSHILEELSKLATDYGIINNGALLQEITREELLSKCSEKITLTVDNPNKAVPVLDKMGFVHYMIVDKNHIDVYERLNDSAALNTALVTAGVSVAQLAVTGMELETYFLSITGGATNV